MSKLNNYKVFKTVKICYETDAPNAKEAYKLASDAFDDLLERTDYYTIGDVKTNVYEESVIKDNYMEWREKKLD